MTTSAIQDVLRQQKTFEEIKEIFKIEHNLKVKEYVIFGKKVITLTRDIKLKFTSIIQDEASFIIIDENLKVIAKGLNKLYTTNLNYINTALLYYENRPVIVQEWQDGIEIIISKFNHTFLISTKDNIYGHPYNKIVMNIIDKKFPQKGLSNLFDIKWSNNISWTFNLVKYNGQYELYLTGGTNLKSLQELSTSQINNIAMYLNFKTYKHKIIYTESQLKNIIRTFVTQNITLKYITVKDQKNNCFKIPIKKYSKTDMLIYIAKHIIKHNQVKLNTIDKKYDKLIDLIKHRYYSCILELCYLFTKNENIRTRKVYAARVKHHPMSAAIFALKDNKIKGFYKMENIIKPIHLLNIVKQKDHIKLYSILKGI